MLNENNRGILKLEKQKNCPKQWGPLQLMNSFPQSQVMFIKYILLLFALFLSSCIENSDNNKPNYQILLPFSIIDKEPAWSSDNKLIVYYHLQKTDSSGQLTPDTSGLYLIEPEGENKRLLLAGFTHSPDWSPSSNWIVFEQGTQIYKIKANGDSLTQLTFQGRNFFPSWSPDGQWIAYDNTNCGSEVSQPTNKQCGILIMSIDGKNAQFIVRGRYPNWSPTGRYITYMGLHNDIYEINIGNPSSVKRITNFNKENIYSSVNRYPKYSPNGKNIIFLQFKAGVYSQIWVISTNGDYKTQLTKNGAYTGDWSPDGRSIVFTNTLDGRLWTIDPDGTNWQKITSNN